MVCSASDVGIMSDTFLLNGSSAGLYRGPVDCQRRGSSRMGFGGGSRDPRGTGAYVPGEYRPAAKARTSSAVTGSMPARVA